MMKMKKISKSRWTMLALVVVGLIVVFSMSGCSMLEEQMASMQASLGFAGDKEIIECTSNTESGCEGWVASETTGSTTD